MLVILISAWFSGLYCDRALCDVCFISGWLFIFTLHRHTLQEVLNFHAGKLCMLSNLCLFVLALSSLLCVIFLEFLSMRSQA